MLQQSLIYYKRRANSELTLAEKVKDYSLNLLSLSNELA